MEGDANHRIQDLEDAQFQSTPSAWRATKAIRDAKNTAGISIHALRMEGDAALKGGEG